MTTHYTSLVTLCPRSEYKIVQLTFYYSLYFKLINWYKGLNTVFGQFHIYFIEREIPEKTTEDEEEINSIQGESHLLCAGQVKNHVNNLPTFIVINFQSDINIQNVLQIYTYVTATQ